jgi:heavy metal sensor kinase
MRSIRLSLTVYFLVLLAVALGTASVLAYRTTKQTLLDKEQAAQELLQARYEKERRKEEEQLDKTLFQQARTVAQFIQFQQDWSRWAQKDWFRFEQFRRSADRWQDDQVRFRHQAVELFSTAMKPNPSSFATLSFWATEPNKTFEGRFPFPHSLGVLLFPEVKAEIKLQISDPLPPIDDHSTEYFQINSVWGTTYYSQSLKGRHLAFDDGVFRPNQPTINLEPGQDVRLGDQVLRRVALTTPVTRWVWPRRPTGGRPSGGSVLEPARPAFYIQYACDTTKRDAVLAELAGKRDEEMDSVREETRVSLAGLRTRLLVINGCAFVALVLGICVLVPLGLRPLNRVGEAVSRVSEKDFRLQLGTGQLPHELTPIVERLTQTLEQLKSAFAREKQATADISHELRTPLSALMTTIDVTLRKPRSADEYREALDDCKVSAKQIHEAVERLLALARLDAGVDRLRSQQVDAANLARQCVSVVKPLAEAHGLQLRVQGDDSALLSTDPDKLREILNNLLHNAIQYNRQGGSIDVKVQRDNGHLELRVHDTGIGIPAAARPHIFERFYRADPSRHADGLHAGLGLAIVKGYLDLMGGSIDVDSVEGQGSTFNVRLPA